MKAFGDDPEENAIASAASARHVGAHQASPLVPDESEIAGGFAIAIERHEACDALSKMMASRWLAVAIVMLTSSACSATSSKSGDGFEGEIDMTEESAAGPPAAIRYFIKGERVRVETTADRISTTRIMDISTNDVFVLDSSSKTYRVVNDPRAVHVLRRALFEPSGKRIVTMNADRIAQSKEPSTLFEVPSEYNLVR